MDMKEFSRIRHYLGKTQRQMAQLLGISPKAIQSFEQGWRIIPVHSERQILFLLALKNIANKKSRQCWELRRCPPEIRQRCPAWEFRAGWFCWFVNGTICKGKVQRNWHEKLEICRECPVYLGLFQAEGVSAQGVEPSDASAPEAMPEEGCLT